ncbi:hypothetical protein NQZ68_027321 [Dissostichus eleginoides]|nr:hypothetical protein NQZ68_027321 [Dissostichus eleginoides]
MQPSALSCADEVPQPTKQKNNLCLPVLDGVGLPGGCSLPASLLRPSCLFTAEPVCLRERLGKHVEESLEE